MIIALSQRVTEETRYRETRDALSHDWYQWVEQYGGIPLAVPNGIGKIEVFLDTYAPEFVILTGGNTLCGISIEEQDVSPLRDGTERKLLDYAIRRNLPVLGVCRGMQMIQTFFGGRLSKMEGIQNHVASRHELSVRSSGNLHFEKGTYIVNSYHKWGIASNQAAEGFIPFAQCPADGTVEGFYHLSYPITGIMWHPERGGADASINRIIASRFLGIEDGRPQ